MESEQLGEILTSLRRDLDLFNERLDALETAPVMTFRMDETIAQRRRVVKRMREAGLSVERIARALDAGRTTILRDLAELGLGTPAQSLGVNGRTWHRRSA